MTDFIAGLLLALGAGTIGYSAGWRAACRYRDRWDKFRDAYGGR
jgi:hypothetical protein